MTNRLGTDYSRLEVGERIQESPYSDSSEAIRGYNNVVTLLSEFRKSYYPSGVRVLGRKNLGRIIEILVGYYQITSDKLGDLVHPLLREKDHFQTGDTAYIFNEQEVKQVTVLGIKYEFNNEEYEKAKETNNYYTGKYLVSCKDFGGEFNFPLNSIAILGKDEIIHIYENNLLLELERIFPDDISIIKTIRRTINNWTIPQKSQEYIKLLNLLQNRVNSIIES